MNPADLPFDAEAMLSGLKPWIECESPTFDAAAVSRMVGLAARDLHLCAIGAVDDDDAVEVDVLECGRHPGREVVGWSHDQPSGASSSPGSANAAPRIAPPAAIASR